MTTGTTFATCRARVLTILAIAVGLSPWRAAAQVTDTVVGSRLLVNPVLRGPFPDTLTLELFKHAQYRIAVWPSATQIRVVPQQHADRDEFAPRVREGDRFRATAIELYPQETGPHLLLVSPPEGGSEVRIWIWEDSAAETVARIKAEHRWSVGLSAALGVTTGYVVTESSAPGASQSAEAGVLIGSGSRLAFLLGFGNDPRPSAEVSVNWAFVEPRFRVVNWKAAGREMELNAVLRWGQGNSTSIAKDPSLSAIGVLVTWHLDHRGGFRGWLLGAEALVGTIANLDVPPQRTARFRISLSWLP